MITNGTPDVILSDIIQTNQITQSYSCSLTYQNLWFIIYEKCTNT